ncbi:DeoR/GlpR family DNA-binding transcription regulator [Wukongibacter baidiensis]|uniref:DeoR/GlpR family DNA-binding transcription regulator n=1 Tax=Wukongibacter baidiensis TaxID=1723361 RepID=UPI003D7F2A9A
MFIEERHNRIMQLLSEQKRVEVSELSSLFDVSLDSIRRDLRILEKKGLLKRTHGGAISLEESSEALSYSDRKTIYELEKEEIGQFASTFIEEGDTILIKGSSTSAAMIPHLCQFKDLTIFTNSIDIAYQLNSCKGNLNTFMIGGMIDHKSSNTYSTETLSFIQTLHVDKAFLSPCSISMEAGICTEFILEAHIDKAIIKSSKETYILADHSKFLKESLMQIAPLSSDYAIISDSKLSDEVISRFESYTNSDIEILRVKKK